MPAKPWAFEQAVFAVGVFAVVLSGGGAFEGGAAGRSQLESPGIAASPHPA